MYSLCWQTILQIGLHNVAVFAILRKGGHIRWQPEYLGQKVCRRYFPPHKSSSDSRSTTHSYEYLMLKKLCDQCAAILPSEERMVKDSAGSLGKAVPHPALWRPGWGGCYTIRLSITQKIAPTSASILGASSRISTTPRLKGSAQPRRQAALQTDDWQLSTFCIPIQPMICIRAIDDLLEIPP